MDKPEALRLADELDAYHTRSCHKEAAAELRRLHELNVDKTEIIVAISAQRDALLEALRKIESATVEGGTINNMARAAIKAVEGEKT